MKVLLVNCSPVRNGATAEILKLVQSFLGGDYEIRSVCIDDYRISFCKGCRSCHATAECVQEDDVPRLMAQYQWADVIVSVSPSYWADVPGQFKAFIDRCTPWCDTHQPHASIGGGLYHRPAHRPQHEGMPPDYRDHRALLRPPGDPAQGEPGALLHRV